MKGLVYCKHAETVVVYDGTEESEKEIVNLYKKITDDKIICIKEDGLAIMVKYKLPNNPKPHYAFQDFIDIGDYVVCGRVAHKHKYWIDVYTKEQFEAEYIIIGDNMTRQSIFLKTFPNAAKKDGMLCICPKYVAPNGDYFCDKEDYNPRKSCYVCKQNYWFGKWACQFF